MIQFISQLFQQLSPKNTPVPGTGMNFTNPETSSDDAGAFSDNLAMFLGAQTQKKSFTPAGKSLPALIGNKRGQSSDVSTSVVPVNYKEEPAGEHSTKPAWLFLGGTEVVNESLQNGTPAGKTESITAGNPEEEILREPKSSTGKSSSLINTGLQIAVADVEKVQPGVPDTQPSSGLQPSGTKKSVSNEQVVPTGETSTKKPAVHPQAGTVLPEAVKDGHLKQAITGSGQNEIKAKTPGKKAPEPPKPLPATSPERANTAPSGSKNILPNQGVPNAGTEPEKQVLSAPLSGSAPDKKINSGQVKPGHTFSPATEKNNIQPQVKQVLKGSNTTPKLYYPKNLVQHHNEESTQVPLKQPNTTGNEEKNVTQRILKFESSGDVKPEPATLKKEQIPGPGRNWEPDIGSKTQKPAVTESLLVQKPAREQAHEAMKVKIISEQNLKTGKQAGGQKMNNKTDLSPRLQEATDHRPGTDSGGSRSNVQVTNPTKAAAGTTKKGEEFSTPMLKTELTDKINPENTQPKTESRIPLNQYVRMELSDQVAKAVKQQVVNNMAKSSAALASQKLVFENGHSVEVSARQKDNVMQIHLGNATQELHRMLMKHADDIKLMLQERLQVEVELQFDGGDNTQGFEFDESGTSPKGSEIQTGSSQEDFGFHSSESGRKKYLGFNQNEWIG